jgi:hypothetical protein
MCHYPSMDAYFSQTLPETLVRVTNDTGTIQRVAFYGGSGGLQEQRRTLSEPLGPGEFSEFIFLPSSTRRLVMVFADPYNPSGYSKYCDLKAYVTDRVDLTITEILDCDQYRQRRLKALTRH